MSNVSDTNISKLSYTAKDFASLYPEVLDLAKELTNKWDPSQSNESDPGVVLLKEAAFVADHNNYNIDKNILENFLPSATQEKSVRNITEMNGYTPRYYISANGQVSLKWTYDSESDEKNSAFTIPAFTLTVSDSDNSVVYTQVSDINVQGSGIAVSGDFLEGTIQTLSINDSTIITYENLDNNNRIYFPESMVAQNGIYVKNINSEDYADYWTRDNYLLTRPNESRIYKLDYDSSKGLPYIEFPSDIANLIGDGLQIKYITTSGASGNVTSRTLTTIVSPSSFTDRNGDTRNCENFVVNNIVAISNGKDPETINEMYKSFKKIIGTFDTLVSCNDYSNAIKNIEDSYGNHLVSNAYVTDRRTDYNKAARVITYDEYKNHFKIISLSDSKLTFLGAYDSNPETAASKGNLYYNTSNNSLYVYESSWTKLDNGVINLNDFAQLTAAMTPYDLVIYALTAFSMSNYSSANPYKAYKESFIPVQSGSATMSAIKEYIEDNKCVSHTYKDSVTTDIAYFKNYAPLTVTIQPYNKVTKNERNEILNNVYRALTESFNASELEFGEELDYTEVRKVIINADSRINDASVNTLNYTMKAVTVGNDGNEKELDPYSDLISGSTCACTIITDMIAKNVLAGRVCLFNLDDEFNYGYGQVIDSTKGEGINRNLTSISSELAIPLSQKSAKVTTGEYIITKRSFAQQVKSLTTDQSDITYTLIRTNGQNVLAGSSIDLAKGDQLIISVTSNGSTTKATYENTYDANGKELLKYSIQNNIYNSSKEGQPMVAETKDIKDHTFDNCSGTIVVTESKLVNTSDDSTINLDNYTLDKNECIQIISPNYYTETSYGVYVNYRYANSSEATCTTIKANTEYTLKNGEYIVLQYTNDGVTKTDILLPGDTVKTSFDLSQTVETAGTYTSGTKKTWTDTSGTEHKEELFKSLTSSQTIEKRELMKTVLDNPYMMCYWIINSSPNGNKLFENGESTKILESDDYFIYADSKLDEIVILGSGTKLTRHDTDDWTIKNDPISIDVISENGSSSIVNWQKKDFATDGKNLEIQEMSIISLGETNSITITGWSPTLNSDNTTIKDIKDLDGTTPIKNGTFSISEHSGWRLNNDWQTCNGTITYTTDSGATTLAKVDNFYQIRSRLNINIPSESYQQLNTIENGTINDKGVFVGDGTYKKYQRIMLTGAANSGNPVTIYDSNTKVQASYPINVLGNRNCLDLSSLTDLGITVSAYAYHSSNVVLTHTTKAGTVSEILKKTDSGYSVVLRNAATDETTGATLETEGTLKLPFHVTSTYGGSDIRKYLLPVYIQGNELPITIWVEDSNQNKINIKEYNTDTEVSSYLETTGTVLFYVELALSDKADTDLNLVFNWTVPGEYEFKTAELILIDDFNVLVYSTTKDASGSPKGELNSNLANCTTATKVLNRIKELIKNSDSPSIRPYYGYSPENSMKLEKENFQNATILWDPNNVANMMTLPVIDFDNSDIDIVTSMRKY